MEKVKIRPSLEIERNYELFEDKRKRSALALKDPIVKNEAEQEDIKSLTILTRREPLKRVLRSGTTWS